MYKSLNEHVWISRNLYESGRIRLHKFQHTRRENAHKNVLYNTLQTVGTANAAKLLVFRLSVTLDHNMNLNYVFDANLNREL